MAIFIESKPELVWLDGGQALGDASPAPGREMAGSSDRASAGPGFGTQGNITATKMFGFGPKRR
jgi:hypothetical protein